MTAVTYEIMRAHLMDAHDYKAEYFDTDYPIGGPINDLKTLRWLHEPWCKEKGHRDIDLTAAAVTAGGLGR